MRGVMAVPATRRRPQVFDNLIFRQLFDAASSTYTYLLGDPATREAVIIDTVFEQHLRDGALDRRARPEAGRRARHALPRRPRHRGLADAAGHRLPHRHLAALPARPSRAPTCRSITATRSRFGARHLEVRATPGHTDGCLTLVLDDRSMAFYRRCAAHPRRRALRLPAGRRATCCTARSRSRSSRCPTSACSSRATTTAAAPCRRSQRRRRTTRASAATPTSATSSGSWRT